MELQKTLYECYRWRANWGELVMARQRIELAPEEAEELSRRARATTVPVRDRQRAEIILLAHKVWPNSASPSSWGSPGFA